MLGNSFSHPRLLVFVLVCAAVMSFIVFSDAARASPTTQEYNGMQNTVPRQLYSPYSQHPSSSIGLPPTETGLQTGIDAATVTVGNYRGKLSNIDQQSEPLQFTQGIFSDGQSNSNNRQSRVTIAKMQRGHSAYGARPVSSTFISRSQHKEQSLERWQPKESDHTLTQKEDQTGNVYNSHSVINRNPSPEKSGSRQSSSFSYTWDHKYIPESYSKAKVAKSNSLKMDEKKYVKKSSYLSLSPSQTGAYWDTLQMTPRRYYSGYKETNESPVVRLQSTLAGGQSSHFFSSRSHIAPRATPFSGSSNTPVIKRNPSTEELTSSITNFPHEKDSISRTKTLRHKKVKLYHVKDSPTSVNTETGDGQEALSGLSNAAMMSNKQRASDAQIYRRLGSNFNTITDSVKQANVNLPHSTNVTQYGGQMHKGLTRYQSMSRLDLPRQITTKSSSEVSLQPPPIKGQNMQRFVPATHVHFRDVYSTKNERPLLASKVNTTTRNLMHNYKPRQPTESIYDYRQYKNPLRQAVKKPSVPTFTERTNSKQYSFDNVKDFKFKNLNIYPGLLPKYSFGQRGGSTTTIMPAKLERIPTDYFSPSPDTLLQTTTPRPFISGSEEVRPPMPKGDAGMNRNQNHRQFRTYKIINGLRRSTTPPLEGAKPLVQELENSGVRQQYFQSFEVGISQTWQPRSFRIPIQTGETVSGSSDISTVSPNELSSKILKPSLKTAEHSDSIARLTPDKNNSRISTSQELKSIKYTSAQARNKMQWKYPLQDPASVSHIVSSAYLRSPGDFTFAPRLTSKPRTPYKNKPPEMRANLLNTSTSRSVRAKRVKVKHTNSKKLSEPIFINYTLSIFRLPKQPARVKAVTYADVLGSASFSGLIATTPTDKDNFPNVTATIEQKERVVHWTLNSGDGVYSGKNMTNRSESNAENETRGYIGAETNKLGKTEEANNEMKTLDFFLDNEDSGSGGFNLSEVLSSGTGNQAFSKDLLELDYLRMSTGNVSFKSVNLTHPNANQ